MSYRDCDGTEYDVGDFLGFKDGVEQYGKFVRREDSNVVLSCWDADVGERYERVVAANRVWVE